MTKKSKKINSLPVSRPRRHPKAVSARPKHFFSSLIWPLIAFFLLSVILINMVLYSRSLSDPIFTARLKMSSLSSGERYHGRLLLWNHYAQNGDWASAGALENGLDPVDISRYKSQNHPDSVKKQLNQLMIKPDKTADDWIQLARFYLSIGKTNQAVSAVDQARALDPIRPDIEKIYQDLQSAK